MSTTIRIPQKFIQDHQERDLDTPCVLRRTKQHCYIAADDPALDEMLSDAEHYAEGGIPAQPEYLGLISSARATMRAIRAARQK